MAELQIAPFEPAALEPLLQLIYDTIDQSYAGVYGPAARQFFKEYHCKENVIRDAAAGCTIVATRGGELAGTGTLVGEDIRRVFIAPRFQGRGIGRIMMESLENRARLLGLPRVSLSASLPAQAFYHGLGYRVTADACDFFDGEPLHYFEMVKEL